MAEFTYGGAAVIRPDNASLEDLPGTDWDEFVYLRTNPAGSHREYWFHGAACRTWFIVMRDAVTHACLEQPS